MCTSPPYGSLKTYPDHDGQLGNIASYERFLDEMDTVWTECLRILVPGGRIACVVGDVCVSRRAGGRHYVLPLSGDLQVRLRKLGFDCLTPIRWMKVANINLEASRSSHFFGKPNLPNGIVKNDIEHILFFRKSGGYRNPTPEMERLSRIETDDYAKWFAPVWTDVTGQLRRDHPAPYPIEVPRHAVSTYVREQSGLAAGPKKAAQIRLSNALGRAFVNDLHAKLPMLRGAIVGERKVAGALRTTNADVSETHELDGLRLAVELKPVNLAVGRAIWNRFGDLRTFAVNLHLKFPFAVIGGVLVIPTYEEVGTRAAAEATASEEDTAEMGNSTDMVTTAEPAPPIEIEQASGLAPGQRSTRHLIERAVQRLVRAGGRKTEADAAHLLEGIAVIAYDPNTGRSAPDLPAPGSGLRWEEFIDAMAKAYEARFEG